MSKLGFGEREFKILQTVRELKVACVREVYQKLGSPGAYTTIMTIMGRMVQKGDLKRKKEGKQYLYWVSEEERFFSNSVLKRMQEKFFGGKIASLLTYLIEKDETLSDKDLNEIEKLIQQKRKDQNG